MQEYFEFDQQKIKIPDEGLVGSFPDVCTIEIEGISPIHARVYHSGEDVMFVDLLSAGSSINGLPVQPNNPVKLNDYDTVELCSIKMIYRQVEDPLFMDDETELLNDKFYNIADTGDTDQLIDLLLDKIDRINSKVSETPVIESEVFSKHYSGYNFQQESEPTPIIHEPIESNEIAVREIKRKEVIEEIIPEPSEPIYLPESLETAREIEVVQENSSPEESTFDLSERTIDIDVQTIKALSEKRNNRGADFNHLATKINS